MPLHVALPAIVSVQLGRCRRDPSAPFRIYDAPCLVLNFRHGESPRLHDAQRLAESLGDPVAVAAMVDRLVYHAEVIVLMGDSYHLRVSRRGC